MKHSALTGALLSARSGHLRLIQLQSPPPRSGNSNALRLSCKSQFCMSSFALGPDGECQVPFASRLYAFLQKIASRDQVQDF